MFQLAFVESNECLALRLDSNSKKIEIADCAEPEGNGSGLTVAPKDQLFHWGEWVPEHDGWHLLDFTGRCVYMTYWGELKVTEDCGWDDRFAFDVHHRQSYSVLFNARFDACVTMTSEQEQEYWDSHCTYSHEHEPHPHISYIVTNDRHDSLLW